MDEEVEFLLIYTHKISARFSYIMKHVFTRILGIEISYTTKIEDFIKHKGPKITYTKQPLQNEFFIRSTELLFEQGINDVPLQIDSWDGVPCFFAAGEGSALPYDIFAASFYLLSRYEEYLPHLKDIHGRFPPRESVAYQNNFLQQPVIDLWAAKLLLQLKAKFPDLKHQKQQYQHTSIIDVTTSHCFSYRGFVRSIAGFLLDVCSLKLRRVVQRVAVWFNPAKDPYDNFEELIALHKKYATKSRFFFQFADYSTYDKNVSPNNNKFRYLIKSVADYGNVSLAASYSSFYNIDLLKKEKKKLANVINRSVSTVRLRYNRVDVPETYRTLVEAEFTDDYSMGYTHEIGFRAGTCTPFYFFDINLEIQQPIKIHPFALHDYALLNMVNKKEIQEKIANIASGVKTVNGQFITVFSNELIGGDHKVNWLALYEQTLKENVQG